MQKFHSKHSASPNTLILLIIIALALFSCSGPKKIQTEDDSAEYRSAKALPPLKKNTPPAASTPAAPDIPKSYVPEEATDDSVTALVVSVGEKHSRLQINTDFDKAWNVLSERLKSSNITVHHRNRNAGRIAIGCGELDDTQPRGESGGWSVFTRKPTKEMEYCALQMLAQKRSTVVQVLNRNAQEVDKAAAEQVFNRLLRDTN